MSDTFDDFRFADAIADPRSTFGSPGYLLSLAALSDADKELILESWQKQERTLREFSPAYADQPYRSMARAVEDALRSVRS